MRVHSWQFEEQGKTMVPVERDLRPGDGEVVVQVAGCGVCHTDLGFVYDGVPTRHPLPLTLGHEVSGVVVETSPGSESWNGRAVIVPAVMPCGECLACKEGRGSICRDEFFPGNDAHGGFATHLAVPAHGLCPVPELQGSADGLELTDLAVIADAVATPYQALLRSGGGPDDLAVFVGVGGVGGFGVQLASARRMTVAAVDVDAAKLERMKKYGADLTLLMEPGGFKEARKQLRAFADERGIPTWRRKIFETSGTPAGQETAFRLLQRGGYLSVIGYTPRKVQVHLSRLMALDATVRGNWGCLPEHFPAVVDLVVSGKVAVKPFVERRPLSSINDTLRDVREGKVGDRVILVPENNDQR